MSYKIINNEQNSSKASSSKKNKNVTDFIPIEPEWTLEETIFPVAVKEQLNDVIAFCRNRDRIVQDWELYKFLKGKGGCIAVNMWGLPGTGKSIAAEAIANALGKKLIQASYATLIDSLQGKTEKNLSSLFETAVQEDCVILFDEADGLLSARKSGSNSEASNLIKSHLLNILDRSNAIVVFTTNFFKSYDRAFVRRILWNIEVPAPGYDELLKIWQFHLGANIPRTVTYEDLTKITLDLAKARSMFVTGGDVRKLTLTFCTRLTASRFDSITSEIAEQVIAKYLDDLQESNPVKESIVKENELRDSVKSALNSKN